MNQPFAGLLIIVALITLSASYIKGDELVKMLGAIVSSLMWLLATILLTTT